MESFNFEDYNLRFSGVARLYGTKGLDRLRLSHVLIVGVGGVGAWVAEALARSGVGAITLVDLDDICITNTNRQLIAMDEMFGKMKVRALKDRILAINPQCKVSAIEDFFTAQTAQTILNNQFDFVVDAIDSLQNKCVLAASCREKNLPLIVVGGAAGKKDPTQVKVDDLGLACNDSLLFSLRKRLRQEFSFPSGAGFTRSKKQIFNIACVYSPENPVFPLEDGSVCSTAPENTNLRLDCHSGMGAITHLTGTFGFMAAHFVLSKLTKH